MKYYVYRYHNRYEFKRTKCNDYWSRDYKCCWQYSKQGAKKIVERETAHGKGFYQYGMIEVSDAQNLLDAQLLKEQKENTKI